MKTAALILLVLLSIHISCREKTTLDKPLTNHLGKEISFYTTDSVKVYGDLYALDNRRPIILLFHQGGSNAKAEYGSIIPRLIEKKYNILAIDQRLGGQIYGHYNRTIAEIPNHSFDNPYTYCDAYNNLEGALDFIINSGFTGEKVLWGSSYSASLAIKLAHQYQEEVSGVLAFSPASGGPMKDCRPEQYLETLQVPLLLLRPPGEMESESAQTQFKLAEENKHRTYIPKYGIHGSSMLVRERVGQDVSNTWKIVMSFLESIQQN